MSKSTAATFHHCCRKHGGWLCFVLSTLTLPASPVAAASAPDPALRRTDELDLRRLGRVSDDERAVLRVAWRSAQTGGEEVHSVQDILDSLRRMETTVGEINRLVRDMPAPAPLVAPIAAKPPEPAGHGSLWALAASALLALLAVWWFLRRNPAKQPQVASGPSAEVAPELAVSALEPLPTAAPPGAAAAPVTPPPSMPQRGEPAGQAPGEATPIEAHLATIVLNAAPALPPVGAANQEPAAAPAVAAITPADPLPATGDQAIEFSLEDEEPEAVARANARIPVPRTNTRPMVPERRQPLNVEPTLQLAEIMLSMGLQQSAAQALIEYAEAHPRQAVYHWLKLLGIYRDSGQLRDFEETAEKLRKHFNIQAADPTKSGTGVLPTLEDFPRVAEQVQQLWPQPEQCIAYLRHLLEDNRDGARAGFPQSVAEEFLLLIEVLKLNSGARQPAGT